MKILIVLVFTLLSTALSSNLFAQDEKAEQRKREMEQLQAEKMAYLIQEAGLTADESGQFFPAYNEMQQKLYALHRGMMQKARELNKNQNASEKEYNEMTKELVLRQCRQAEIEEEYYNRFRKILSPEKIFKVKMAEERFAIHLFRKKEKPKTNN